MLSKVMKFLMALIMMLGISIKDFRVNAEGQLLESVKVTSELRNSNGGTLSPISQGQVIQILFDWDLTSYEYNVHKGDYFTITLPSEFDLHTTYESTHFDLTDFDNHVVGSVVIDPSTRVLTATMSDYVEGKHDIKGEMKIAVTIKSGLYTETGDYPITYTVNTTDQEVTLPIYVGTRTSSQFGKWSNSRYDQGDSSIFGFNVGGPYTQYDVTNPWIEDTIQTSGVFLKEINTGVWITIQKHYVDEIGQTISSTKAYNIENEEGVTVEYKFNGDKRVGFIIRGLPDTTANSGFYYQIRYLTNYVEGIENTAILHSDELSDEGISKTYTYRRQTSSGTGTGVQAGKITVLKTDATTGNPIHGATFTFTRVSTGESFIVATDENGYATLQQTILNEEYIVKENSAMPGYVLDETERSVTATAADKPTLLELTNQPENTPSEDPIPSTDPEPSDSPEPTPTTTPEPSPDVTPEPTPTVTSEPTPVVSPEPSVSPEPTPTAISVENITISTPWPTEPPRQIYAEGDEEYCTENPDGCYYDPTTWLIRRVLSPNTSDDGIIGTGIAFGTSLLILATSAYMLMKNK